MSNLLTITRTELVLILAISAVGCVARVANLGDVAVEHFDEGVYASNLLFPDEGFAYPDRHLYAPPLVPSMIEWSTIVFGEGRAMPLLPGVLLGALTIPLIWLVARSWFGSAAGVAAASLLALSDFHIAMSRSALTDVPLVFFLLLAVWLIHEGVSQGRLGVAALGGLATGMAWSAKYNGWLPLAIALSGTAGALIAQRIFRRHGDSETPKASPGKVSRSVCEDVSPSTRDILFGLGIAVIVAGLTWYPVWNDLPNGYAEVSSNHSLYVGDLVNWLPSLKQHEAIQRHYAGIATWLSGLLAAVSAALVLRAERSTWNPEAMATSSHRPGFLIAASRDSSSTWNENVSSKVILVVAVLTGSIVLSPVVVLLIWPLVCFVTLIVRYIREARTAPHDNDACSGAYWLALWFGLAWLIGLILATPIYRPYPRLFLPLQCVAMIGTSAAVVMLLTGRGFHPASSHDGDDLTQRKSRLAWLVPVVLLCAWRGGSAGCPGWQTRTELAEIAARVAETAAANCQGEPSDVPGFDLIVYVYGEPGLLHHLPTSSRRVFVKPVMDLGFTKPGYRHEKIPAFVLAGPHALTSLEFQIEVAEAGDALEEIDVFPYRPSDFVLLDDVPPEKLEASRAQLVRLYRVHFP